MPNAFSVQMSERTTAYDIKEVGDFRFWTDEAAEADVRCSDCDPNLSNETCSWNGKCNATTKSCVCDDGFFGDRCQVSYSLPMISEVKCQARDKLLSNPLRIVSYPLACGPLYRDGDGYRL